MTRLLSDWLDQAFEHCGYRKRGTVEKGVEKMYRKIGRD